MNIFIDSKINDDRRRRELFDGSIFVHAPCASAEKLCELARQLVGGGFSPARPAQDPRLHVGERKRSRSFQC